MTILAMFPIIPQHLSARPSYPPPTSVTRPSVSKKVPVTVFATVDVPALSSTAAIPVDSIVRAKFDKHKLEVGLDERGVLRSPDGSVSWLRHARVSPDCHSANLVVRRVPGQAAVCLQAVRDLRSGDQLSLWFGEEVLAEAGIPFLTPRNIQGEKNYICHLCKKRFEYPNPLKIHLALECGTLRRVELWKRLLRPEQHKSVLNDGLVLPRLSDIKPKRSPFNFKDFPKSLSAAPSSPDNRALSTASNPSPLALTKEDEEAERPSSEPTIGRYSAFKPYLSFLTAKTDRSEYKPSTLLNVPSNLIFSSPPFSSQNPSRMAPPPFPTMGFNGKAEGVASLVDQHAVEMETLVSNLGRSKQGHLCIYCGKVYSRKYGLKIHIRTHTGFKPLKCKYCLRPFGDPSNLNKHVRLHAEGETPYKCEECGKVLVRRRDLDRHIKSRHQPDNL